ncbi:hypothetical protein D3C85_982240 [compost metagenome]
MHQEGTRAHGRVADLEIKQFGGGFQCPLLARCALSRADIGNWRESLDDDRFGQRLRSVVGASFAPVGTGGNNKGTFCIYQWVTPWVGSQKISDGQQSLPQHLVAMTGREQMISQSSIDNTRQIFADSTFTSL